MHSPCLQFIWHTLVAKRIFWRYCFHLFPPLYQHFQWALPVSSDLKSLLPAIEHPEIHPHPHASPGPAQHHPVRSLLGIPVSLCYVAQIQCSFCCPFSALDGSLCMCCRHWLTGSVYGGMNCWRGARTKRPNQHQWLTKAPPPQKKKAMQCTGTEFQQWTWMDGRRSGKPDGQCLHQCYNSREINLSPLPGLWASIQNWWNLWRDFYSHQMSAVLHIQKQV